MPKAIVTASNCRIAETQRLGILDAPVEPFDALLGGALAPDIEHCGVDVGHGDMRAMLGHAEGDVAGAARHVEDVLARARLDPRDEAILPQPMHPARHGVVHDVVAFGHAGKDFAHFGGLFRGADLGVAEGDGVAAGIARRVAHGWPIAGPPQIG
jgi:hypothetical protein